MRLNKFIARAAGVSRRTADEMIESGSVRVNDQVAHVGQQVEHGDSVRYGDEQLELKQLRYVLLHKPVGYVCSRRRQDESPTVYELLPQEFQHLQVAGRLDKDSSGLLLLTNDGDYALHLTHPRYQKTKNYNVSLNKPLESSDKTAIASGVDLEDGVSKLTLDGQGREWRITMHEGRNRQIRRTFEALGYQVVKLHRTSLGPYTLAKLGSGEYHEVDKIKETL